MPSTCSVTDCTFRSVKIRKPGLLFHRAVGKDEEIQKIWLKFTRRPKETISLANLSICSEHFEPDAYERDIVHELLGLPLRKKLKVDAIPTIYPEGKRDKGTTFPNFPTPKRPVDPSTRGSQKRGPTFYPSILRKKRKVEGGLEKNIRRNQKNGPKCCLLCYSPVNYETCDDDESSSSLLLKQLHVIFILRGIFEIPSKKLVEFVQNAGNPEDWISLCENCSESIRKIKILYDELMIATDKFQKARECIKRLVNESKDGRPLCDVGGGKMEITNECRNHFGKTTAQIESEQILEKNSSISAAGIRAQPSQQNLGTGPKERHYQTIEIYFTHDNQNEVSKFRPNPRSYWNSLFTPDDSKKSPSTSTNQVPHVAYSTPIVAPQLSTSTIAALKTIPITITNSGATSSTPALLSNIGLISKTICNEPPNKKPKKTPKQTKPSPKVKRDPKIRKTHPL